MHVLFLHILYVVLLQHVHPIACVVIRLRSIGHVFLLLCKVTSCCLEGSLPEIVKKMNNSKYSGGVES
jgi:hypothetical protein